MKEYMFMEGRIYTSLVCVCNLKICRNFATKSKIREVYVPGKMHIDMIKCFLKYKITFQPVNVYTKSKRYQKCTCTSGYKLLNP